MRRFLRWVLATGCLALCLAAATSHGEDSLRWHARENKVDADIKNWSLTNLLARISRATGWQMYVEPINGITISCKFQDLSQAEALRRLLGSVNYAKDETNGITRLRVYRSSVGAATQLVKAAKKDYRIANEALVKLKKGSSTNQIDSLAKALGAKVVGRNDQIGFYRLQFADASAANAAMQSLASDPSVGTVDANYSVDRPTPASLAPAASAPAFNFNAQPNANSPVIGLVDTAAFPQGQFQSLAVNSVNVTGQTVDPGNDPTHGTMMFETLAEAMANAPGRIQNIDVFGTADSTTTYEVMEGVITAVNSGDNPINLSLGGTDYSQMMADLIQEATKKGFSFIASTGNTPGEGEVYPACYPGVYSVTASTLPLTSPGIENTAGAQLAPYANDPTGTMLMAPGTSYIQWGPSIYQVEGTSPAAADITGAAVDLANQYHIPIAQALNQLMKALPPPRP